MSGAHDDAGREFRQRLRGDAGPWTAYRRGADEELEPPGCKPRREGLVVADDRRQANAGAFAQHALDELRGNQVLREPAHAERDLLGAAAAVTQAAQLVLGRRQVRIDDARVAQEAIAGRGELGAA